MRIPNKALWYITGMALVLLFVTLHVPSVSELFHFSRLHPWQYVLCLGTGMLAVIINELAKLPFFTRFFTRNPA
jgi:Ca2+-transporting ATPase